MRVALLGWNAPARNAIGQQLADKAAFFHERGAALRIFLQDITHLHPALTPFTERLPAATDRGPQWEYLSQADLVIADYAQWHELLHFLPLLANERPRLVLDYHGVTPPEFGLGPQRDLLERSVRARGIVWCCDVALAHSQFAKDELRRDTGYPDERIIVVPYAVDVNRFCPSLPTE
ncbi:MAG: glycosyltransferase [Gemmataceae bacterium]|nr:glycosyltransferase [Gemmataceae bacterium]